jgi:hypothetical protein
MSGAATGPLAEVLGGANGPGSADAVDGSAPGTGCETEAGATLEPGLGETGGEGAWSARDGCSGSAADVFCEVAGAREADVEVPVDASMMRL